MAKIFYGNGECEVQGEDIIYCELRVKYPIEIDDKSPDDFIIKAQNNKIIIAKFFPNKDTQLKSMFNYTGELNIIRATVINKNREIEHPVIKRVMDYTELLTSNSEDMTTLSENLKSTHTHGRRILKMKLLQPYIENMTTVGEGVDFYLEDGSTYSGYFHISHEDGKYYTGAKHTEESVNLYFKDDYKGDIKEELIQYSFKNILKRRNFKTAGRKIRKRRAR